MPSGRVLSRRVEDYPIEMRSRRRHPRPRGLGRPRSCYYSCPLSAPDSPEMHGESNPRLLELTREECVCLLASAELGRLAVNVPDWPPLIRPVSYVFDEPSKSVVFRTARGSKFHALTHAQRAAFEIDGHEPAGQTGWSVIVVGAVEEITNPAELSRLERSRLRSWVPGDAPHWMRIRATLVSGRRIGPA
jgi:uncharacterized protein